MTGKDFRTIFRTTGSLMNVPNSKEKPVKYDSIINPTLWLVLIALICSCDRNRVFEENITLPNHRWDKTNVLVFNVEITDTINPHNICVNVRNGGQYQYSNLFLFIRTVSPSGQWIRDTIECTLADQKGRWLGSGLGDIATLQVPYKVNVRFPYRGLYSFEIEQAMRTDQLKHVFDIGLRVERMK
jgi:gliding motility-associated lipoprotein GldH